MITSRGFHAWFCLVLAVFFRGFIDGSACYLACGSGRLLSWSWDFELLVSPLDALRKITNCTVSDTRQAGWRSTAHRCGARRHRFVFRKLKQKPCFFCPPHPNRIQNIHARPPPKPP